MARTTIDLDATILRELKRLQKKQGKTLGRLVSELLARALAREKKEPATKKPFKWITRDMGLKIDLYDKEALWKLLDEDGPK